MALNAPIKIFRVDVAEDPELLKFRMIQESSFVVQLILYQGDTPIDLSDATELSFVYSDCSTFEEVVSGVSSVGTDGVATFTFTPTNMNHYGLFEFYIRILESDGNTIIFPYGEMTLLNNII
jgi:hypothetical protein